MLELTANPNRPAVGAIIEAKLEKGRGPVATVLVQEGTLRTGDAIVTGTHYGRVRAMMNEHGRAGRRRSLPGYSAEVVGLSGVPTAGDTINVVEDEKAAKEIAEHRALKERAGGAGQDRQGVAGGRCSPGRRPGEAEGAASVVIKADVQGSVEAVAQAVQQARRARR